MEKEATEDITNLMNTNRRWKTKACGGTDYHSHVLPKMDDGAKEIEISIEMLRKIKQQGISTVYATPHYYRHLETVDEFLKRRKSAFETISEEVKKLHLHLKLGAEIYIERELCKENNIRLLSYENTQYILLEFPRTGFESWMLEEVEAICYSNHLIPVFAHLERYLDFFSSDEIAKILAFFPAIVQVNWSSLKNIRVLCWTRSLIRSGHPVIFGTDCHNLTNRKPDAFLFFTRDLLKAEMEF